KLATFGVGRRGDGWCCLDLGTRSFLGRRLGSAGCSRRCHACPTRPDQDAAVLICRDALAVDQRILEVFEHRVVELELPLEGAVGQAPPALEHGYSVVKDLLKGHG